MSAYDVAHPLSSLHNGVPVVGAADATFQTGNDARRQRVPRVLKRAVACRKIAAGKARRAKIMLLFNQGLTARERTLYPPNSTFRWMCL